jgi:hypothetical protein
MYLAGVLALLIGAIGISVALADGRTTAALTQVVTLLSGVALILAARWTERFIARQCIRRELLRRSTVRRT